MPKRHRIDGYAPDGTPRSRTDRREDTLVPARGIMQLVNNDETFVKAMNYTDIYNKKLYKLVYETSLLRVKQSCDFVVSILEDNPSFFYYDIKKKVYDASILAVRERARNLLISLCTDRTKPILTQFAGKSYWKKWPPETMAEQLAAGSVK